MAPCPLLAHVRQLFAAPTAARPAPSPGLAFRPRLEGLEAREVPATFIWTGGWSSDPGVAYNWWMRAGSGYQTVPGPGDTAIFDGKESRPIAPWSMTKLASLELQSGFTGTVNLTGKAEIGRVRIAGGTLKHGDELTTTNGLLVTGGSLNPDGGTVRIRSQTSAEFYGGADSGPTTGDTIVFEPGLDNPYQRTRGSFVGIITFQGGAHIKALTEPATGNQNVHVGVDTSINAINATIDSTAKHTFGAGDELVVGNGTNITGGVKLEGGKLELVSGTTAKFGGTAGGQGSGSVDMTSGRISIPHGSTLEVANGLTMSGGELRTTGGAPNTWATIKGNLTVSGGGIFVDRAGGGLKIAGDMNWTGGTYHAFMNNNAAGSATQIWVTGKLTTTAGATISVQAAGAFGQGAGFNVIVVDGGYVGPKPTVTPAADWEFKWGDEVVGGNPRSGYVLKK